MTERKTIVIAEIGENHLGNLDTAKAMVLAAHTAGADIVKFQSYRGEDVASDDPEKEWFGEVELSDEAHRSLLAYAQELGVSFLSSPFTLERARFLCEGLGLRQIKVASSEMLNKPLLEYLNQRTETIFISTGMSTVEEIREATLCLSDVPNVYILHCVTQYPLIDKDANLLAIPFLRQEFPNHIVGYSDHTIGIDAPIAAVALGAQVIEKHFTLSKLMPGTDHVISTTPEELNDMVFRIRRVEALLGQPLKQPIAAELEIRHSVRNRWKKD